MLLSTQESSDLPPIPPTDLIYRVVSPFGADDVERERRAFDNDARASVRALEDAVATLGHELGDFGRIMDFGCGPGRIMRYLGPLAENSQLHGVDIDPGIIDWCSAHIPFAEFTTGPHEPPLPYPPESFDLIFNHSVFTHLDEHRQDLWLAELQRLLRPGGIALLTVHSTRQWNRTLADIAGGGEDADAYRDRLERDGIVFLSDDGFIGTTHPDWYHTTFHAPWYIHEHWTQFLSLRAYIHEGSVTQDMIILERLQSSDSELRPIGHASETPPVESVRDTSAQHQPTVEARRARLLVRSMKRRLLAGELTRLRNVEDALANLASRVDAREAATDSNRALNMMRYSLYQQGERISVVERELREQITELSDHAG
jgi:SAM-dependent methyltransferase